MIVLFNGGKVYGTFHVLLSIAPKNSLYCCNHNGDFQDKIVEIQEEMKRELEKEDEKNVKDFNAVIEN